MTYHKQGPEPPGGGNEGSGEEPRLIREAQQGDQESFEALLRLHDRRIFAIIGGFIRRKQDVEDLAQEVFLKAYQAIGRFRPGEPFAPWVNRIAVNTCYDHLRATRRRPEIMLGDLADSETDFLYRYNERGAPSSGGEALDRVAARDLAERILATLPPKDRLAITLREVQGFEIAEIASALGCSGPAAKVRLFRARRAMQGALQRLIRQEDEKANRARRSRGDDLS